MNDIEKINFRQARDFGEVFNATTTFIRQNFKHFFSSLIAIAGPFIFITAIAGAYYQSSSLGMIQGIRAFGTENYSTQFGISAGVFLLASIISNLVLIGTINAFIINYIQHGPNNFTIKDVSQIVLKNTVKIIRAFFASLLALILIIGIFGILIGVLFLLNSSVASGLLAIGILIIGGIIFVPPFFWQLSITYLIAMYEQKGGFASINRSFKLMKGNFWWTWVIMICASMAIGMLSFVFSLPQTIYQFVIMFTHLKSDGGGTSIPFIIVATICTFFSTLTYSIIHIISAFHYYSLAEQKEGLGLLEKIDEIGNTTQSNEEQYY